MPTLILDDNAPENVEYSSIPSDPQSLRKELNAQKQEQEVQPPAGDATPQQEVASERPDWLPPKFKNEEEFVKSHQELELTLGRQADEIGSLRKLTAELSSTRQAPTQTDQSAPQNVLPDVTADDVLNDPRNAIAAVAKAAIQEELASTKESISTIENQLTMGEFQRRHPSFETDQHTPEFAAWLQEDHLRIAAAQRVVAGDLGTADQLFTAWETHKNSIGEVTNEPSPEEVAAEQSAEAIASSGGLGAEAPKQYVRRADLDEIMNNNRDYYDSPEFQSWMQEKYRQGLVK